MTLDPRRRFTSAQRTALYLHADGRCERCGRDLDGSFDADHLIPHSRGGRTEMVNGAAGRGGLSWPRRGGLKWPHFASVVVCVDLL
jgi:hypothetical protein